MPSSRLRAKVLTAVPVLAWPYSTDRTLAKVAASASKDERSERMASTCVMVSPDTGVIGVEIGVVAGVDAGVAEPPPPPELPIRPTGPPPPEEVELVVSGHVEEEGVTVTVAEIEAVKVNEEVEESQVVVTVTTGSVEILITFCEAAVTVSVEPESTLTEKLVAFTVSVSIVALEPLTFMVTPFTLMTVSVVSVTSLYAPNATEGSSSAISIPVRVSNFFIMMNSYKP